MDHGSARMDTDGGRPNGFESRHSCIQPPGSRRITYGDRLSGRRTYRMKTCRRIRILWEPELEWIIPLQVSPARTEPVAPPPHPRAAHGERPRARRVASAETRPVLRACCPPPLL